jgi:hypothetical protein
MHNQETGSGENGTLLAALDKAASLQLKGNVSLYGLNLTGPLPGGIKSFIANKLADDSVTTGNQLFCMAVGP